MRKLLTYNMIWAACFLSGCLQDNSSKEINESRNQGDFTVVSASGSGNENGGGNSTPNPSSTPSPTTGPLNPPNEGFLINRGQALTTSRDLFLDHYPPFYAAKIKVNEGSSCTGGTWVDFSDTQSYRSSKTNQKITLAVQYRDYDMILSPCYTQQIVIDEAGPEILFAKYPTGIVEEGSEVEIVFSVNDYGTGVEQVLCQVGNISKACAAGENKILFSNIASGVYSLRILARDRAGFSSEKEVQFEVSSLYKKIAQSFRVNQYSKVDILFVIDNSGSMAYEQQSMASRVRNFLDVVKGLDWQIGITTTDTVHRTLGDGRLIPLYGTTDSYLLNSSMPDADARNLLSMTLQRPETGSGKEQGIYTAFRAIERSLSPSEPNAKFIRSDAQLAVVLISDEDESDNTFRDDPTNFVNFIRDTYNGQKTVTFHSVIARPDDVACLSGEGASAGYRYEQISKLTGGVIGDVCASDYAAQVQGIAEGVRRTLKSITLSCIPVVNTGGVIEVKKDGQVFQGAFTVQGLNLVFNDMLPEGQFEVLYSCLK